MHPKLHELTGIALWGARGHAKVLAEIAVFNKVPVLIIFDRQKGLQSPIPSLPVCSGEEEFSGWLSSLNAPKYIGAIAAIGGWRGADRLQLMRRFAAAGLSTPNFIHPTAWVSPSATIGMNCHVLAQSVVGPDARIGDAVIINTGATVDHECFIEDGVHIAPGAHLCGEVNVGTGSFIGAGATILPRINVGNMAVVGAGAVVTKDVSDYVKVIGCPAQEMKKQ